jgi:short-subunit dehydrogenase
MALPSPIPRRSVVVTGASSGIGAALGAELAARGHDVILVARRGARLEQLARRLRATHEVAVEVRTCDLADEVERSRLIRRLTRGEAPAGLCNNAGVGGFGRFHEGDRAKQRTLIALNVNALHDLTAAVLPGMVAAGSGAVLNVASILGHGPQPHHAAYGASKAFVLSFSEALHAELAGTGVSCTAISPGPVRTDIFASSDAGALDALGPDLFWQDPEEVARAAVDAMERGERSVVPGLANQLAAAGWRYAPRSLSLPVQEAVTEALPKVRRALGL